MNVLPIDDLKGAENRMEFRGAVQHRMDKFSYSQIYREHQADINATGMGGIYFASYFWEHLRECSRVPPAVQDEIFHAIANFNSLIVAISSGTAKLSSEESKDIQEALDVHVLGFGRLQKVFYKLFEHGYGSRGYGMTYVWEQVLKLYFSTSEYYVEKAKKVRIQQAAAAALIKWEKSILLKKEYMLTPEDIQRASSQLGMRL